MSRSNGRPASVELPGTGDERTLEDDARTEPAGTTASGRSDLIPHAAISSRRRTTPIPTGAPAVENSRRETTTSIPPGPVFSTGAVRIAGFGKFSVTERDSTREPKPRDRSEHPDRCKRRGQVLRRRRTQEAAQPVAHSCVGVSGRSRPLAFRTAPRREHQPPRRGDPPRAGRARRREHEPPAPPIAPRPRSPDHRDHATARRRPQRSGWR